jgi:hypothetical protein
VLKLKHTAHTETHVMVRLENKIRIKRWQRKSIQEGTRNGKEKQMKHGTEN